MEELRGGMLVSGHPDAGCMWLFAGGAIMTLLGERTFLFSFSIHLSAPQAVLSRMQVTFHAARRTPHGSSSLVHAFSAW